ncbi:hypothetical protein D3C76_1118890 [compost metagenome]
MQTTGSIGQYPTVDIQRPSRLNQAVGVVERSFICCQLKILTRTHFAVSAIIQRTAGRQIYLMLSRYFAATVIKRAANGHRQIGRRRTKRKNLPITVIQCTADDSGVTTGGDPAMVIVQLTRFQGHTQGAVNAGIVIATSIGQQLPIGIDSDL